MKQMGESHLDAKATRNSQNKYKMWILKRKRTLVMHPAAAFLLFSFTFLIISLYSCIDTADYYYSVQRLVPAAKVESKQELEDELSSNVNIFDGIGLKFLPNFKNPCWYDRQGSANTRQNLFFTWLKPASAAELVSIQTPQKRSYKLKCLPYFFLIGQPKCATTDVFKRINLHPDVAVSLLKGPQWWTRRRYGQPYSPRPVTFKEYLDLFSNSAKIIGSHWENSTFFDAPYHQKIIGDGSTSTLWDGGPTMTYLYSSLNKISRDKLIQLLFAKRKELRTILMETNETSWLDKNETKIREYEGCCFSHQVSRDDYSNYERTVYTQLYSIHPGIVLPITTADIIHAVLPKSQIIAVIREPISRLFSSYLYFMKNRKLSPEGFDRDVRSSIRKWKDCTSHYSERTCAYNKTLQYDLEVRLYNGMYNIFLRDWLNVFPPEQLLILRMEDYHQNVPATMASIYAHLGLRALTEEEEFMVNTAPVQNKNRMKLNIGKMLNSTAEVLREFYSPYNEDLSNLLHDEKFLWNDYIDKIWD